MHPIEQKEGTRGTSSGLWPGAEQAEQALNDMRNLGENMNVMLKKIK